MISRNLFAGCRLVAIAILVAVAYVPNPVHAGVLTRCGGAVAVEAGSIAVEAGSAEKRCVLPWNCPNGICPNGKCRPPQEVNVTVAGPVQATPQPVSAIEPPHPAFPWGLAVGVIVPVTLLAGVAAFAIRMQSSSDSAA